MAAIHFSSVSSDATDKLPFLDRCKGGLLSNLPDARISRRLFLGAVAVTLPIPLVLLPYMHGPEWTGTEEPTLLEGAWKEPASRLVKHIFSAAGKNAIEITEMEPPIRLGWGFDSYAVYFKVMGADGPLKGRLGFRIVVDPGGARRMELAEANLVSFFVSDVFDPQFLQIQQSGNVWLLHRERKNNPIFRFSKAPSVALD